MARSVLFVCLGNICRSPAGEAVLRSFAQKDGFPLKVASCGLGDWHIGAPADPRTRKAAAARGYEILSHAQAFDPTFFQSYDIILAADESVLDKLLERAPRNQVSKIYYMTHFSEKFRDQEVPDPYYKGEEVFEQVMDMLEDSCRGLMAHLKEA